MLDYICSDSKFTMGHAVMNYFTKSICTFIPEISTGTQTHMIIGCGKRSKTKSTNTFQDTISA